MKNHIQPGKVLDYVNSGGALLSGAVVDFPGLGCGIAKTDIGAGETGPVEVEGVVEVDSTGAIAQGVRVYWNGSAATTTAGSNTLMGYSFAAAASNRVKVKLVALADSDPGNLAQGAAVADLNQTIGVSPSQAEVQAISDKVDELLASLRAAGLIAT